MRIENSTTSSMAKERDQLRNKEKRELQKRTLDIQALEAKNREEVNEVKKHGNSQIAEAREALSSDFEKNKLEHEQKLEKLKQNLQATTKVLNNEEELLKNYNRQKFDTLNEMFQDQYENKVVELDNLTDKITAKNKEYLEKLNFDAANDIDKTRFNVNLDINQATFQADNRLKSKEQEFNNLYNQRTKEYDTTLDDARMEHEKSMQQLYLRNLFAQKTEEGNYKKSNDDLKKHYSNLLIEQKKSFDERYGKMLSEHQNLLQGFVQKNDLQLQKLQDSYAAKQTNYAVKAEDSFYNIRELKPTISDLGNAYEVHLEVAPHEKDNVRFSGRDRNLKLTLARQFGDEMKGEMGETIRAKRSEILSRDIPVSEIVNPKTVSMKYNDGILTYKISKL